MVAPVAVAGAGAVNLPGAAGGLPKLTNPAVVQADFATRFAAGARLVVMRGRAPKRGERRRHAL
eukprot:2469396-Prymnesium_polylepis.1